MTIPALSSMVLPVTVLHQLRPFMQFMHPTISGMPEWGSMDSYKNCKIIIDNCAPYDIVLPRNEIRGVLKFEPEQCLPLNEDTVTSIISNIEQTFPK